MPLPIAVEITPAEAPREHVTVLLAACGRASADTECVPAADVPANGSSAVALVTWTDAAHVVIEVGVRKEGRPEWRSKKLEFRSSDAELERWRAIGFVVGVLSRDESTLPAPSEANPSGPSSSPSAPHSSAPSSSAPPANGSTPNEPAAAEPAKSPESAPKVAEKEPSPARRERPPRTRPRRRETSEQRKRPTITLVEEEESSTNSRSRWRSFEIPAGALDLGAAAGPALEGIRVGGLVRVGFHVIKPLRAAFAVRYLDRPIGQGSYGGRWITGSAGLGLDLFSDPVALTLVLDGRAEYFEARAKFAGDTETGSRILPGLGLGLNLGWMLTPGFGLFLGVEGSGVLKDKQIVVKEKEVATDSALNVSWEVGFRLGLW